MNENLRMDLEPAFLIHRRAFRETSALLEVFSEHHGRLGMVARGANRPRSTLRVALTPFAPLLMSWSGRGELATLRSAELASAPNALFGNALLSGMYLNELLMRLTHRHDPHPELFGAYGSALAELSRGSALEQVLRIFEKRLLESIGYALIVDSEANDDQAVLVDQQYRYIADFGPTRDRQVPGEYIEVHGATLLALANEQTLTDSELREAKRLMRFLLSVHLGSKPLASRELFRS